MLYIEVIVTELTVQYHLQDVSHDSLYVRYLWIIWIYQRSNKCRPFQYKVRNMHNKYIISSHLMTLWPHFVDRASAAKIIRVTT